MERHKIIVVIPSYNEFKTLKKITTIVKKSFPILVIDDHSSDKTLEFLKINKIAYIRNNKQIGYEKSLIKGFKYVLNYKKKIKNIITMDADGEHLPLYLQKFKKYEGYNLVIGKRDSYNRLIEHVISYFFKKKFGLQDPLSGFKMYSTLVLKKQKKFTDNFFLVDLASNIIQYNNKKSTNINIKVKKRDGKSKLNRLIPLYLKMIGIILFIIFFIKRENKT